MIIVGGRGIVYNLSPFQPLLHDPRRTKLLPGEVFRIGSSIRANSLLTVATNVIMPQLSPSYAVQVQNAPQQQQQQQ